MLDRVVALDIETSNGRGSGALDPRAEGSQIALIQMAFEDGAVEALRPTPEVFSRLEKLRDEGYRFIIHNANFELDWLYTLHGLELPLVWDTMIASQLLNAGKVQPDEATLLSGRVDATSIEHLGLWDTLLDEDVDLVATKSGRFSHSLQATVYRYAKAVIQKDQGTSDWLREPLTADQIRYAEDDVRYLIKTARRQLEFLQKFRMEGLARLEMGVLLPVAKIRAIGIQVDEEGWREEARGYEEKAAALEESLNEAFGRELAQRSVQVSLFEEPVPVSFKVSSPAQIARFFGLETADESLLKGISHPLMPKLLQFREYSKLASTYGESYLAHISTDGRIHTQLKQAETATGRFSSSAPNNQNLPPDMLKHYLVARPGKLIVYCDYSSVESRILAYAAEDESMIKSVNSADVHWENAKKTFKLPPDASKSDSFEINGKTWQGSELRRKAKGVSFGIPYGISCVGLVNRGFAETEEEGEELINAFLGEYRKVDAFLKLSVQEALINGYTQDVAGRIRWYEIPKGSPEEVKKARSAAARQAQNHRIQSTSADITKQAIVDTHDYLGDKGDIILTVHDSIIFEIDEEDAGTTIKELLRLMEEAGSKILPGIITPVDADVGRKETRSCAITGLKFDVFSHVYEDGQVFPNEERYEPRVSKIVKGKEDKIRALKDYIIDQTLEWRKSNNDLVEVVQLL